MNEDLNELNLVKTWERESCESGKRYLLEIHDLHKRDQHGKSILGYRFWLGNQLIFEETDFHCSPLHCITCAETIHSILGFVYLQPGDTDREYFDRYTPIQMDFAYQHGEHLMCLVMDEARGIEEFDRWTDEFNRESAQGLETAINTVRNLLKGNQNA